MNQEEYFCACLEYEFWYKDEDIDRDICRCGHLWLDHLGGRGTCLGYVIIYTGDAL